MEREILGEINMEQYGKEMREAKELAIASLRGSFFESPGKPAMTLEKLRAIMDKELPGVSLSRLIMDEQELGY